MTMFRGRGTGNLSELLNKIHKFEKSLPKRGKPTTIPRLRDLQIGMNPASAHILLQEFVFGGYVNKIVDKDNKRSFLYELTPKGENFRQVLEEYQNDYIAFDRKKQQQKESST